MPARPKSRSRKRISVWLSLRVLTGMAVAGLAVAVVALAGILLFSEDALLSLPSAASDLSSQDVLYLRAYLRVNADALTAPSAPREGLFEVQAGQSASEVCDALAREGWIGDSGLVCAYLRYTGGDRRIAAGMYVLRAGQSPRQIADSLVSGSDRLRIVTVYPGWRIEEVALAVGSVDPGFSASDMLAVLYTRPGTGTALDALYADIPPNSSLEGFLFPEAYRIMPGETPAAVAQRMLGSFDRALPYEWRQAYGARGLSLYQAVILASIVQREAVFEDEMPMIASVYLNRLAIDMKLDADPTVQYAIGFQPERGGWWTHPLAALDMEFDSPYNTYRYRGFPPGPICNPGLEALQAIAFPAESGYYYFQAACDGSRRHNFAVTYQDHLRNSCGAN